MTYREQLVKLDLQLLSHSEFPSMPNAKGSVRATQKVSTYFADPNFVQSHPYNAQLARCILKSLSLQESAEIIQLINHPLTLFNLSHFLKGPCPLIL